MIVSFKFTKYNPNRYGTPWGAVLKWEGADLKPKYDFVGLYDDDLHTLEIPCQVGDVIALGQKDIRHSTRSLFPQYYVIQSEDAYERMACASARKAWKKFRGIEE